MTEEILPTLEEIKELIRSDYRELEKEIIKERRKERDQEDADRLKIISQQLEQHAQ